MGPKLYELLFGICVVYFWNVWFFEKGLNRRLPAWRHIVVTLWGASAFFINTALRDTGLTMPVTLAHTLLVVVLYYFLLVKPLGLKPLYQVLATLTVVTFIAVFMSAEGIIRAWVNFEGLNSRYAYLIAAGMIIAMLNWEVFRREKRAALAAD